MSLLSESERRKETSCDLTRYAICAVGDRVMVRVDPDGPYVLFDAAFVQIKAREAIIHEERAKRLRFPVKDGVL
jgi:hypothetical protein